MAFDAEIKVRVSSEEKKALQEIADGRKGNPTASVIVREAIQEYLERTQKSRVAKKARREKDLS